jgi:DNA-binding CsgD family transcriptional regulator
MMLQDEVLRFIQSFTHLNPEQRTRISRIIPANQNTVVIFSCCGETVCTYFTSKNFNSILGYPAKSFIEEGIQFVISRAHPMDLPQVLKFMEACHRPSGTWFEDPEAGTLECTYRFKHPDGEWRWVTHRLRVLTLTSGGLLNKVMMTFSDCTIEKKKLTEHHLETLAARRNNSKLIDAVVDTRRKLENQNASMMITAEPLTCREKEVLKLVAKGYSSKQIADELYISKHTVESHRKNLLQKLKANNSADLIQKAQFLY